MPCGRLCVAVESTSSGACSSSVWIRPRHRLPSSVGHPMRCASAASNGLLWPRWLSTAALNAQSLSRSFSRTAALLEVAFVAHPPIPGSVALPRMPSRCRRLVQQIRSRSGRKPPLLGPNQRNHRLWRHLPQRPMRRRSRASAVTLPHNAVELQAAERNPMAARRRYGRSVRYWTIAALLTRKAGWRGSRPRTSPPWKRRPRACCARCVSIARSAGRRSFRASHAGTQRRAAAARLSRRSRRVSFAPTSPRVCSSSLVDTSAPAILARHS